jgi:ABC-type transport system involved in multi-copper enzyme maturation permease subunit
MKQIFVIALKEVQDGMRNRWVILIALSMAAFALILALLGSVPTGMTKISTLAVTVVSLASLGIFFIPLISLLLTYDSIVGEAERGTLILLLSYPIARWQVIAGKFCGALVLLFLAVALGYGSAGIAIGLTAETAFTEQAWSSLAKLLLYLSNAPGAGHSSRCSDWHLARFRSPLRHGTSWAPRKRCRQDHRNRNADRSALSKPCRRVPYAQSGWQ